MSKYQTSTDQKENEKEKKRDDKKNKEERKEPPKKEPPNKEVPKETAKEHSNEQSKDPPKKIDGRAEEETNKQNEPSGMDVVVKEDGKKTKMDDGYEDFGPGAQQNN
ncbi:hypothetical protein L3Y34_002822 [Caenorhabditis briggsae]|nr:hypothetical protein L3Y34_002822 [Caenorhabditis briggsae]